MVLKGPEVQRLVVLTEIGSDQSALSATTSEPAVDTGPGVVASQPSRKSVDAS